MSTYVYCHLHNLKIVQVMPENYTVCLAQKGQITSELTLFAKDLTQFVGLLHLFEKTQSFVIHTDKEVLIGQPAEDYLRAWIKKESEKPVPIDEQIERTQSVIPIDETPF